MTTTERIPDGPGVEPCVEHSLSGLYRGSTWARACIDRAPVPVGSAVPSGADDGIDSVLRHTMLALN